MGKVIIFNDCKESKNIKTNKFEKSIKLRQKYQEVDDDDVDLSYFDSPEWLEVIKEQEIYGEFEAFYEQKHYKEIQKEYEIWRKEHGYE